MASGLMVVLLAGAGATELAKYYEKNYEKVAVDNCGFLQLG